MTDRSNAGVTFEKPFCPYCGRMAELVDSKAVYAKSYGNIWICFPCDAWVGVHQQDGLNRPLGRLANRRLRILKMKAHIAFDPLWKGIMVRDNCSKSHARRTGYQWLAAKMGLRFEDCRIGMFDEEQCRKVVEICSEGLLLL